MTARLVLSVSGIDDTTVAECAEFETVMATRGVRLSLLVTPRPGAAGARASQPPTGRGPGLRGSGPRGSGLRGSGLREAAAWLAARRDALVLHGYDHVAPAGAVAFGRRAEFALLPAHEAGLRLTAATAVLEHHGLVTDVFAPPRWLASPGTLVALRRRGFAVCADIGAARDLRTGRVHRGRVFGVGRSATAEPWWCRAMVLGASRRARRGALVRLAVDAADLRRAGPTRALLDAVDIALHHGARSCTYRDLVRDGAAPRTTPATDTRPATRHAPRDRGPAHVLPAA